MQETWGGAAGGPGTQTVTAGDEAGVALLVGEGVAGAAVEGAVWDMGTQLHGGLRLPLSLQADLLQGDGEIRAVGKPSPRGGTHRELKDTLHRDTVWVPAPP